MATNEVSESKEMYVSVILPFALPVEYTYHVPNDLHLKIQIGVRVEVSLKNKLYSGIVSGVVDQVDTSYKIKDIITVLDERPIVSIEQIRFWKWVADYYCCTMGEVMHAALPSGLKLDSTTKLVISEDFNDDFSTLDDDEYLIAEAISIRKELSIAEVVEILDKKTIYPVIRTLIDERILVIKEELNQKYKPKLIRAVKINPTYKTVADLSDYIDQNIRSDSQARAILAYLSLSKNDITLNVPVTEIYEQGRVNNAVIKALEKKGVFQINKIETSRIQLYGEDVLTVPDLSEEQAKAIHAIDTIIADSKPVLIHGVTGSGKTRIYMEIISKMIAEGRQSLYLLPEIALTTQIVERLQNYFGDDIVIYHSKLNNDQRVEIWNSVLSGKKVVLSARSGIFLPFKNLGLIIVDEEHDPSFKQTNPSPRYNARDLAIVLGQQTKAGVILGSATPSLESYYNARKGKYGLITINKRYGNSVLPRFNVVDLRKEKKVGRLKDTNISKPLKDAIADFLSRKKQVIVFQNRRGFAPVVQCNTCGWLASCKNCDVTLTLHRFFKEMKCHYCGYREHQVPSCPECGSDELFEIGQGTERIEEDLKRQFPEAVVKRMDHDTTRSRSSFEQIIYDFSVGKIDILVGTQMVTKGFDFDHLGLVGIINADSLTKFPDFRAGERAFQLMTQVAGRAGRRGDQGQVYIQAFSPNHPTIDETINYNYNKMFHREMHERKTFKFPPFYRLIDIELRHAKADRVKEGAIYMAEALKKRLGHRVSGPNIPSISRIKNKYIQTLTIRLEKDPKAARFTKQLIKQIRSDMWNIAGIKSVSVKIDVDPY